MSRRHDEAGLTLVEVLVGAAIGLIALVAGLQFFQSALTRTAEAQVSSVRTTDARLTVDAMVRELRQAYTGDATLPVITVSDPKLLTFHTPDAGTPMRIRRISYRLSGGWLQRRVARSTTTAPPWAFDPATEGPWVDLLQVRDRTVFTYLDASRAAAGSPGAVREIAIELVTTRPKHADRTFRTSVHLRNLA